MGTWGTNILGNDLANDVYQSYIKLFDSGLNNSQIRKEIEKKFPCFNAAGHPYIEDNTDLWLGWGQGQWECFTVDHDILQIIEKIIAEKIDVTAWKELGGTKEDIDEREQVLTEFLAKLKTKNRSKRKRKKKEKKSTIAYNHGDLFTFPIHMEGKDMFNGKIECEEWGYGRIILDLKEKSTYNKVKNTASNFHSQMLPAFYVELYKETSEFEKIPDELTVLIPNLATSPFPISTGKYPILENRKIQIENVVFRECYQPLGHLTSMRIGELSFSLDHAPTEDVSIITGSKPPFVFGLLVLVNTNREKEIRNPRVTSTDHFKLENIDLRFNKNRSKILNAFNIPLDYSYYELSLKHGFDLKRLF